MTRTRSPAMPAPQTLDEALILLRQYAVIDAHVAQLEATKQAEVARIQASADSEIHAHLQQLKDLTLQLKPWWAVARDEVTGGKRKSIELGGCVIGYRVSSPKLTHDGKQPEAIERLQSHEWAKPFIRTKLSLDKPAIIKAIGADLAEKLEGLGFKLRPQRDQFFVDRVPPKPVETEIAEQPEAEVVQ